MKSDWDPQKTTIDNSNIDIFTVTQMDLLNNIPPDLKGKGANIAIIDSIGDIPTNGFHMGHHTFSYHKNKEIEAVYDTTMPIKKIDDTFQSTICAGIAVGDPFEGYTPIDGKNKLII